MLPIPSTKNDHVELMPFTTSQPKFIPKKPVMNDSGRNTVPTIVSCFITSFWRLLTVER